MRINFNAPDLASVFFSISLFASFAPARVAHEYQADAQQVLQAPQRIVSLSPTVTEILFALGAGHRVVGVTRYCDRPKAAKHLPKVGGFIDPQLEAILALKPDLVIAMPSQGMRPILDKLRSQGVRVAIGFGNTIAEFKDLTRFIAQIVHRSDAGKTIIINLTGELRQLKPTTPIRKPKKVLVVISPKPLIVAGVGTYPEEALQLIGARSAVPKGGAAWPTLSLESLVHIAPDVIIVADGPNMRRLLEQELAPIRKHAKLKHMRIVSANHAILQRPGMDLPTDIRILSGLLQ